MSHVYLIGDTHFGHLNVCRFREEFENEKEHSDFICARWREVITKRDKVYVLGDAAFSRAGLARFAGLPGRKILVRGNHDEYNAMEYLAIFEDVCGILAYKGAWLSHAPMHRGELRGRVNIHGHSHNDQWGKGYINVCAEHVGYTPQEFNYLMGRGTK